MGWIGVDFDGTLCQDNTAERERPVAAMLARVKAWRAQGIEVRIVTARASKHGQNGAERELQLAFLRSWMREYIGEELPLTAEKDYAMKELWDDRAVTVEKDTGRALAEPSRGYYQRGA